MRPLLTAALVAMLAVACGDDGSTSTNATEPDNGATVTVEAADFAFRPETVRAAAGSTVTVRVRNTGEVPHSFTVEGTSVDEELDPGASATVSVELPDSGPVTYFCQFHRAQMEGTFVTGGAATGSSTTESPTTELPSGGGY